MKRSLLLCAAVTLVAAISLPFSFEASSDSNGAPVARAGAPLDAGGANCTSCHAGTATTVPGLITSNIPASGYVPGATYTITASISVTGINKYGFEISPQSTGSNALKGTITLTNTLETQLKGSGKYITHKTAGTSGTGGKTWSFNWTAPAAGSGTVTFYGAFNAANGNNANSGDQIKLSTLAVNEDISGIHENYEASDLINVFPNPVADKLNIKCDIPARDITMIGVFSIDGKLVRTISKEEMQNSMITADVSTLPAGTYFVSIRTEDAVATKRIVKQ